MNIYGLTRTRDRHGNIVKRNLAPYVNCLHASCGGCRQLNHKRSKRQLNRRDIWINSQSTSTNTALYRSAAHVREGQSSCKDYNSVQTSASRSASAQAVCHKQSSMSEARPKRLFNIYNDHRGTGFAGNVWDVSAISPTLTTMGGG